MRIALVAPPWLTVPPPKTGPIQKIVGLLVDGLTARGHAVTLYAPAGSATSAQLLASRPAPPAPAGADVVGAVFPELDHAVGAYDSLDVAGADVVHDHSMAGPVVAASRGLRVVHTLHRLISEDYRRLLERLGPALGLIAISAHQRESNRGLPYLRTIHNAVDVAAVPFRPAKEDYALFAGRLAPYKGADIAVDVARRAGLRLVVAGRAAEPAERRFFEQRLRPLLDGDGAEYVGELDDATLAELMARARMVLCPMRWPEPFGLVMVEAAAAGTPVVALRAGATPEVVEHGVSGFVVDSVDEMVAAAGRIDEISPARCRAVAHERFDVGRMVDEHLAAYREFAAAAF